MILYVYEHCPFCIRPRLLSDMKSIPISLRFLANDAEDQHYKLIGKKIVPILEKDDKTRMDESIDICSFIDNYDNNKIIEPSANDSCINSIMNQIILKSKFITHPRQIYHPMNGMDFPSQSAKEYFKTKKEKSLGISFEHAIYNSHKYSVKVQHLLDELNKKMSHKFITSDYFSVDDILYFPILRGLTIATDVLNIPKYVNLYLERICSNTNIRPYYAYSFF